MKIMIQILNTTKKENILEIAYKFDEHEINKHIIESQGGIKENDLLTYDKYNGKLFKVISNDETACILHLELSNSEDFDSKYFQKDIWLFKVIRN